GHTLYRPCRDRCDHREDAASRKVLDELVASEVFGEVTGRPVRVGISLTSRHEVTDPQLGTRWMIERAAAARRSSLDSRFVGDHHATAAPYYQNVPILRRLLAQGGSAPAE